MTGIPSQTHKRPDSVSWLQHSGPAACAHLPAVRHHSRSTSAPTSPSGLQTEELARAVIHICTYPFAAARHSAPYWRRERWKSRRVGHHLECFIGRDAASSRELMHCRSADAKLLSSWASGDLAEPQRNASLHLLPTGQKCRASSAAKGKTTV